MKVITCLPFAFIVFVCNTSHSQPNKVRPKSVSNANYHPQQPNGMNKADLTEQLAIKKNKTQSPSQHQGSSPNQVKTNIPKTAHTNNTNPHATNAVDSHDKYANQELSYSTGNNKVKTTIKPAASSKTNKTKLMEEEGIYYRRRQ